MKKIILFELNEVPWRVIDDFVRANPTSTLARILPRCTQFETHTEDELSPWITWPTFHRGVTDDAHTITDFNQNLSEVDDAYPPIWRLLAEQGVTTGVCGSLHSYPMPSDLNGYAFYVPDVFAAGTECFPKGVEAFQDFNLSMSRASGRNIGKGLPWEKALRFLASAPGLGIRASTGKDVALHLVDEKRRRWPKVRRRTWQTVLAFDVFEKLLRSNKPAFASFFTNHVASSMHRYWAAYFPRDYESFGFSDDWVNTYSGELRFTMNRFDKMLARLVHFVDRNPDYALWTASSMGQAATEASPVQSQVYLKDLDAFFHAIGFHPGQFEVRPAMLPRLILSVSPSQAEPLKEALSDVVISGEHRLSFTELAGGVFSIHPGVIWNTTDETLSINGKTMSFADAGFQNTSVDDETGQSAYHIPEGSLFVYDPSAAPGGASERQKIATLDIAPSLLANFALQPPGYMRGHSIL